MDCSGFVSMAWMLSKPGLSTFTLPTVSHPIAKEQLQPGDAMLCTTSHVVLFGGWTDASHTHYVGLSEVDTAQGTQKKVYPYPYFRDPKCFVPYRLNNVC